ncbi:MAG: ABC transporter permease subunit [Pseudomonadota bacterium]
MSSALAQKDRIVLGRDRVLRTLLAVSVVLIVASLFAGMQREHVFAKEKSAALETDRSVWMNQGDRNPHSAAHFSRYAFRPASPLALIEPGTNDFAGLAIWMEAHYQDPAVFRRAEDGGELGRFAQLTPAFLMLVVAPLLVFLMLFDSIAGEREDRTLRQLLASGVSARQFLAGKIVSGLHVTLGAFTAVFALIVVLCAILTPHGLTVDAVWRFSAIYLLFAFYLVICVILAIGVSAFFRSRQSAFLALTCIWTLLIIVLPRFGADLAISIHPQPDARDSAARLKAASDTYYKDMDRRKQIDEEVLERYDVASIDDLPINYGAYILQTSEELSEPLFDQFYEDLNRTYEDQESIARAMSLLTPTIAATNLSRAIAGTDRTHQRAFAEAAEDHRRAMVKLLNEDYMYNAGEAGYSYTANESLWAQFEDLDHELPHLGGVASKYIADFLLLVVWLIGSLGFAYWSVRRAVVGEEQTA